MEWILVVLLVSGFDVQDYEHDYPLEYKTEAECNKNRASIIWAWDPKEDEYVESWCLPIDNRIESDDRIA